MVRVAAHVLSGFATDCTRSRRVALARTLCNTAAVGGWRFLRAVLIAGVSSIGDSGRDALTVVAVLTGAPPLVLALLARTVLG
jgi:hypothetical protein